ncbi:hypothetical protein PTKIN_Ptkin16aG0097200 [Pterospermum kingtungense]
MEKEREIIKHFSHPHPLVLNEDQTKEAHCKGCLEPLFGPCFSCGECNCQFHLHEKCAKAPLQITHSPFHSKHPSLTLRSSSNRWREQHGDMCPYCCTFVDSYACFGDIFMQIPNSPFHRKHHICTHMSSNNRWCGLCKQSGDMFYYWCSDNCGAGLDIKCAFLLHNIDGNFRELKYVAHQHPLTFFKNPNDEQKTAHCYWCQKSLVDSIYACLKCRFYLHKKCAQLPTGLHHPCHPKHTLYVEQGHFLCKLCGREHWSLFYRCLPCHFDIDVECFLTTARYTIEDESHHEHQFTRLLKHVSFVCDACDTEGNYISYICSSCHVMIHEKCISLPRFIKITRHHHCMVHNYFFQKRELESHDCGICLGEVKAEYGSYHCVKHDCNFVVHVNCATEKKYLFRIIDQNEADEEKSEIVESSITSIVEVNERGDAVKVRHFSHQHCLLLGEEIHGDDDDGKQCDGCVGSIWDSFYYYCSQCDFILHKTCAELPRRKLLWFRHQSLTTLNLRQIFECWQCGRLCSGFFYKSDSSWYKFCVRCATISHTLKYEGHQHPLFFDFKFRGKCDACGGTCGHGAYICKACTDFALHFKCITLPRAIRHKSDEHIFNLAFHEQKDDSEQYYCDICEKKRDPNLWFYYCAICDNSAHPQCALGKYPFIKMKIGTIFPRWYHPHRGGHDLIFVKASYDTCSECDRPCVDIALKCTTPTCNYIIHLDHCR